MHSQRAPDVLEPWTVFREAGFDVQLASPGGTAVPLDPKSLSSLSGEAKALLETKDVADQLASPTSLSRVAPAPATERMVAYVAGGHGALFDLSHNRTLSEFLENAAAGGAVLAACSHGACALLRINDGAFLKGRKVACFTAAEEAKCGLPKSALPVQLEEALAAAGAEVVAAPTGSVHVVVDGNLVSGQNGKSAAAVARAAVDLMRARTEPVTPTD